MSRTRLRLNLSRLVAIASFVVLAFGSTYWALSHPIFEESLFAIGVFLASIGAMGRAWALSHIAGHKRHMLVMSGPYSLCRNPLYFFSLLLGIGVGFCTETLTIPLVFGVLLGLQSYVSIQSEEKKLAALFGTQYDQYRCTVPCFIPSFVGYSEPQTISISPAVMRSGLLEICLSLILIGALELLEGLHRAGFLPTFFVIY